jgi:6-phosphogluconolactonase
VNSDSSYSIIILKNSEELSKAFCSALKLAVVSNKDKYFNIALSGGSTPKQIFRILSSEYKDTIDWKKVRLFWGDERCVSPENSESNYGVAKQLLIDNIGLPEQNVFRIKGEEEPFGESIRYEGIIKENVNLENSLPAFDLTMLGVGEDGHTASIFPNQINLLYSDKIYATAVHPETNQIRVTITGKVINNSKRIFFLVSGKSKSEILKHIFRDKNSSSLPAKHIVAKNGTLHWYIDQDAAQFIK